MIISDLDMMKMNGFEFAQWLRSRPDTRELPLIALTALVIPVPGSTGVPSSSVILPLLVRPGAVERWRVLNGSVDGRGYIQFQVQDAKGQPVPGAQLRHLAFDGVTLVDGDWNGTTGEYSNVRYTSISTAIASD